MSGELPKATIYTDGACDPNPGPGGWAAILLLPDGERTLSGGERFTTNNRMELTAAIRSLKSLPQPMQVVLYTDSQYLKNGITEWLPNWVKRNWRTTKGRVANQDLWQELLGVMERHTVDWRWVRGHAGSRYNNRVDWLARKAIP